jgi:hypothetical protein
MSLREAFFATTHALARSASEQSPIAWILAA